jgi:hypothetical protein
VKIDLQKLHPVGMHKATVTSIVEEQTQFGGAIKFGLVTDDGVLSVLCSQTYSAKSKLGRITDAILGSMPEKLETDDLKGRHFMVCVEHEETPKGTWEKVTAFAPYKGGG